MAEVRSSVGVPAVSAFGGLGSPSPGTPVIVDSVTGNLYTLVNGVVTRSGNAAAGLTTTITTASLVGKTITVQNGLIVGFA